MAKITKQDVWSAATAIDAAGGKPTVVEIRKRLGVGSYTTITNALREWQKDDDSEEVKSLDVPSVVDEKASQFAADLYSIAFDIASKSFDDERAVLLSKISFVENDRDEAIKISEISENSSESLRLEVEELRRKLSQSLADSKAFELRFNDLVADKERALNDALHAWQEAGLLRGRLEVLESAKQISKPKQKVEKPVNQSVTA